MNCTRFFLKPFVGLFVLILIANGAAPVNVGPKDDLERAGEKVQEMMNALGDRKDYAAAVSPGETALELVKSAMNAMDGDGINSESYRYASDARDWLTVAIKEAKDKDENAYLHAIKARGSVERARASYKSP